MDEGRRFPTAAPATSNTGRERTTAGAARRGEVLVIGVANAWRAQAWSDVRRRACALAGVALVVELDHAERRGDAARVAELEQLVRWRARRAA